MVALRRRLRPRLQARACARRVHRRLHRGATRAGAVPRARRAFRRSPDCAARTTSSRRRASKASSSLRSSSFSVACSCFESAEAKNASLRPCTSIAESHAVAACARQLDEDAAPVAGIGQPAEEPERLEAVEPARDRAASTARDRARARRASSAVRPSGARGTSGPASPRASARSSASVASCRASHAPVDAADPVDDAPRPRDRCPGRPASRAAPGSGRRGLQLRARGTS